MRIVIAGGGKVGTSLCQMLNTEEHDVVLIELDPLQLEDLSSRMDILGILGSASSYEVQVEAGVQEADAFVSVTPHDELNLIACTIAKSLGVRYTVARVTNPEYSTRMSMMYEILGISQLLNPSLLAAQELARMIQFPTALSVESLAGNYFYLVEVEVPQGNRLIGKDLIAFRKEIPDVLVCAIDRQDSVFIPRGPTILEAGDRLFLTGTRRSLRQVYRILASDHDELRSILIIGGGKITYYLLRQIASLKLRIKVIERDPVMAAQLAEEFPQVQVILGDGTNQDLLEEQRIAHYDCTIALTGVDEENILISLFGIDQGVPRNITKVNRLRLLQLIREVRLQTVITPYSIMSTEILRGVRAMRGTRGSELEALYRIAEGQVEALEFLVVPHARVSDTPIMALRIQPGVLIAAIVRAGEVIFPTGHDMIRSGDRVFVVTTNPGYDEIEDILLESRD